MRAADKKTRFRITEEKRRILLVEDDIVNQEMVKESLGETYDMVIVETGEEALDILSTQHDTLSIVLLDLNLPGIKGVDVLRKIKADPSYSRIPVIVMTSDSEAEVECLTLGAIDFIPKPYPASNVILARILRTVELSEDRDILRFTERDHLTGLYNKEFFYRYAEQLDLYHKDAHADAIVVDINHFRTLNDRFGKARGDEILKRVAENALNYVNEAGGIVCRSVADTFMFYCPHRAEYETMLEKLSVYADSDTFGDNRIRLRMGVYPDVDKTIEIERRFDHAKMAADKVRENLLNPIGFYDKSMHEAEVLAEQLVDDFPSAIREKQFTVFYQPKYAIKGDKPTLASAEALVRWNHATLGTVSPAAFIPLFEKNGLVQKLDHYVWSEAAARIREWKARFGVSIPVSVNVSRVDLYDPNLIDKLMKIIDDNGLTTGELLLEITESAYMYDAEQIVKKVESLRKLGFRIEMDDFGSGYSSLSMLSYLPIDALKLDMQFILSAFGGRNDTRLLEAMIQLAASFNIPTIAEGVETEEQMLALKNMGCDIIQGYYFSRPLPAEEFEKLIDSHKS